MLPCFNGREPLHRRRTLGTPDSELDQDFIKPKRGRPRVKGGHNRADRIKAAVRDVAKGVPPEEAGQAHSLPVPVVKNAVSRAKDLVSLAKTIRETMADEWYVLAEEALGYITVDKLKDADPVDLAKIAGIAVDKARIMEGKPTEILAQYKLVIQKYFIQGGTNEKIPTGPVFDVVVTPVSDGNPSPAGESPDGGSHPVGPPGVESPEGLAPGHGLVPESNQSELEAELPGDFEGLSADRDGE